MFISIENGVDRYLSKKEGKYQESIQSSTTPDQGHHMGKWQKRNTQESQGVIPFSAGDHKAARNRQDQYNKTTM